MDLIKAKKQILAVDVLRVQLEIDIEDGLKILNVKPCQPVVLKIDIKIGFFGQSLFLTEENLLVGHPSFSRSAHPHQNPNFSDFGGQFRGMNSAGNRLGQIALFKFDQDSPYSVFKFVFHINPNIAEIGFLRKTNL